MKGAIMKGTRRMTCGVVMVLAILAVAGTALSGST
jgi:hypothetical protein